MAVYLKDKYKKKLSFCTFPAYKSVFVGIEQSNENIVCGHEYLL